jgi:hypothetical protein
VKLQHSRREAARIQVDDSFSSGSATDAGSGLMVHSSREAAKADEERASMDHRVEAAARTDPQVKP